MGKSVLNQVIVEATTGVHHCPRAALSVTTMMRYRNEQYHSIYKNIHKDIATPLKLQVGRLPYWVHIAIKNIACLFVGFVCVCLFLIYHSPNLCEPPISLQSCCMCESDSSLFYVVVPYLLLRKSCNILFDLRNNVFSKSEYALSVWKATMHTMYSMHTWNVSLGYYTYICMYTHIHIYIY